MASPQSSAQHDGRIHLWLGKLPQFLSVHCPARQIRGLSGWGPWGCRATSTFNPARCAGSIDRSTRRPGTPKLEFGVDPVLLHGRSGDHRRPRPGGVGAGRPGRAGDRGRGAHAALQPVLAGRGLGVPGRPQTSYDTQVLRHWLTYPGSGWHRRGGSRPAAARRRPADPPAPRRGLRGTDRPGHRCLNSRLMPQSSPTRRRPPRDGTHHATTGRQVRRAGALPKVHAYSGKSARRTPEAIGWLTMPRLHLSTCRVSSTRDGRTEDESP